ncbi:hypothetical protein [uncultured Limnobacter sp.]|uniref:hypothetical protein n=1 Tax=uncultured Limnobacter sp. TaxID=199681 RepID=UPI0030F5C34D
MNSAATHADVWVLEQELVLLFRQQDQHWIEEMRLPYSEFIGSAIALSSFSLADTAVYLNVFQNTNTAAFWAEQRWAGVAENPLRIIDAPVTAFHQQALTELRGMGKKCRIISATKSAQFNHAVQMARLNQHEFKHLKKFIAANKSSTRELQSSLRLYLGLWTQPSGNYQAIRGVALACTLATFLLMSWHNNQQQPVLDTVRLQQFQHAHQRNSNNTKTVAFGDWLKQLSKFGRSERANLTSLKVSWNEQGEILTIADLERDRKRVPKACTLNNPKQAKCSVGATVQ